MKDLFSTHSDMYKKARPSYPEELVDRIANLAPSKDAVWDCGCGSGQFTKQIASRFKAVAATDLSKTQILEAPMMDNVTYVACAAEYPPFEEKSFDMITMAQSVHWFDFDKFYPTANRLLKDGGIVVAFGYKHGILSDARADAIFKEAYSKVLGPYWAPELKLVEQGLQNIPFPFEEIPSAPLLDGVKMTVEWSVDEILNFMRSWSSFAKYEEQHPNSNPLLGTEKALREALGDRKVTVDFPLFARVGRKV